MPMLASTMEDMEDSQSASQRINMLKIALVVCFAAYAAAEAEAKADADAGLYYGGYGYGYGLGYAGLGYSGLGYAGYGYGYPAYGYSTLGYYGKRSADAEPEAEADAGLYYGGYGYGLGYSGLGYAVRIWISRLWSWIPWILLWLDLYQNMLTKQKLKVITGWHIVIQCPLLRCRNCYEQIFNKTEMFKK